MPANLIDKGKAGMEDYEIEVGKGGRSLVYIIDLRTLYRLGSQGNSLVHRDQVNS